jgi:hypothetical protein
LPGGRVDPVPGGAQAEESRADVGEAVSLGQRTAQVGAGRVVLDALEALRERFEAVDEALVLVLDGLGRIDGRQCVRGLVDAPLGAEDRRVEAGPVRPGRGHLVVALREDALGVEGLVLVVGPVDAVLPVGAREAREGEDAADENERRKPSRRASAGPREGSRSPCKVRAEIAARTIQTLTRKPAVVMRSESSGADDAPERARTNQEVAETKPPARSAKPAVRRPTTAPEIALSKGGKTSAPKTALTSVWPTRVSANVSIRLGRPAVGL